MTMQPITNATDLRRAIMELEDEQTQEWAKLKAQLVITHENLRPVNMIKNAINDFTSAVDKNPGEADTPFGVAAGYIAKKAVNGITRGPLLKIGQLILETLAKRKAEGKEDVLNLSESGMLGRIINGYRKVKEE
jgi:hypothetical protein